MASIAFDSSGSPDAPRPPISLHPAFAAVVALWFAALLGIGSMLLPVVLLERAVELVGISALVPSASPPLGFMARGLIALAAALAGAALGVVIARRVARAHSPRRPSRVAKLAQGARRPIDVNQELGGEALVNGLGLPVNRRRALAIAEDDRPSDFLYMAPLPGHDDDQALALDVTDAPAADEPFELSDALEAPLDAEGAGSPPPASPDEDDAMTLPHEFQSSASEQRVQARQEFGRAPAKAQVEPLPFSAPSLARRAVDEEAPVFEPAPALRESCEPVPAEAEQSDPAPQRFCGDWSSAPLGELGLVQLVQRLGASLERRREWLASTAALSPAPVLAAAAGIEPAPAEEAAQAMAAYFGKPSEHPARPDLREDAADELPIAADRADPAPRPSPLGSWPPAEDEDDAERVPSFTLPLRAAMAPTSALGETEASENEDDPSRAEEPDDGYSSLLAMRNPFAPKDNGFVRVEDSEADDEVEPTVIFPGLRAPAAVPAATEPQVPRPFDPPPGTRPASAAAPADADAALRSALATLQRMSGTA